VAYAPVLQLLQYKACRRRTRRTRREAARRMEVSRSLLFSLQTLHHSTELSREKVQSVLRLDRGWIECQSDLVTTNWMATSHLGLHPSRDGQSASFYYFFQSGNIAARRPVFVTKYVNTLGSRNISACKRPEACCLETDWETVKFVASGDGFGKQLAGYVRVLHSSHHKSLSVLQTAGYIQTFSSDRRDCESSGWRTSSTLRHRSANPHNHRHPSWRVCT